MIQSVAIGAFDGVHLAHQMLIRDVDGVLIIERNSAILTPGYIRCRYIGKPTFFLHFEAIKSLTPHEFIVYLKKLFPQLQKIVVGYDFHFGKNKSGDVATLQELFDEVKIVEQIKLDGLAVHSRVIKQMIRDGNIVEANKLLGREYQIGGEVIQGQGLGKKQFVPTLNLEVQAYLIPKEGIYATQTKIQGEWYKSVTFIGHRVSTDGNFAVETHIIDTDIKSVYDDVEIRFEDFIRENRKFDNLEELKKQILNDIEVAKGRQ